MRISASMTYDMLRSNISANQSALHALKAQIASGRKVYRASDSPGAYELIQRLSKDFDSMDQYARNAERVDTDLMIMDDHFQQALSVFQRASELGVAGANSAHSSATLEAMGKEADELLGNLLDVANFSVGGRYVFSGTETFTKPFEVDVDAEGMIVDVQYMGNADTRFVEVGKGVFIEANVPGADPGSSNAVFQGDGFDLFQDLISLRDRLLSGTPTEKANARDIQNGIDHIVNHLSANGARRQRISLNADMMSQHQVNVKKALEREGNVDIAEAVTRLSQLQSAYQSAVMVSSRLMNQPTLLDYM